jgi:hypothetical protein
MVGMEDLQMEEEEAGAVLGVSGWEVEMVEQVL